MQIFNKSDFKSFKTLARMSQDHLHKTVNKILYSIYPRDSVVATNKYTYVIGDIPVCLVAHMDTVFKHPPIEIFYDKEANVVWSPQGLGADDRAGVFSILKILTSGYKPHVIFTTDEEIGGIGADILARMPCPFNDCRFFIELDRANQNDCVFYDCYNDEFEEFIESYGFETHMGTFSDISYLCPRWGIAGVNLSIGYRDEHSGAEVLFVKHMFDTIKKVENILDDVRTKEIKTYIYESMWSNNPTTCYNCKKIMPAYMMIPVVMDKFGHQAYMCGDCVVSKDIKWCADCGQAVMPDIITENGLCPDCEDGDYYGSWDFTGPSYEGYRVQPGLLSEWSAVDDFDD